MDKKELKFILQEGEGQFIEFKENNPGNSLVSKKEFGTTSRLRNRLIADLLSKTVFMEKVGTGIKRIKSNCEQNKNKVEFKLAKNDFFVILKSEPVKWDEKVGETSEKTSEKIIRLIKENPAISAKDIAIRVGVTSRAVEMQISELKQKGLLKRIGPAKGGHWVVVEK